MFTFWPKPPRRRRKPSDDNDVSVLIGVLFCSVLVFFLGLPVVLLALDMIGVL